MIRVVTMTEPGRDTLETVSGNVRLPRLNIDACIP